MLTLFQNITSELTALEKGTLVPLLLDTLSTTHEKNRHTGKNICMWFNACGYAVSEARLRKMINYIRVLNLTGGKVIIGAGNGYFLTDDVNIIQDQIESLEGRMDSMAAVVDSLKAQVVSLKYSK
jgi:hypothetical protein